MKRAATTTYVMPTGELKRRRATATLQLLGGVLCRPIMEFLGPIDGRILASTNKEFQVKADQNLPYISEFQLLLLKVTMIMSNNFGRVASTCMEKHRRYEPDDDLYVPVRLEIMPYIYKLTNIAIGVRFDRFKISFMTRGILSLLPQKFSGGKSMDDATSGLKETLRKKMMVGWHPKTMYEKVFVADDIMEVFADLITDPSTWTATFHERSFRWIAKEMIIAYGHTVACAMLALCMSVPADGAVLNVTDGLISGIFNRGAEDLGWAHKRQLCESRDCYCYTMRDGRTPTTPVPISSTFPVPAVYHP